MIRKVLDEAIGWYGAVALLVAYALLSFRVLSSQKIIYQVLNFTGALGIVYICLRKGTYPPGVLNIVWSIVALIALVRLLHSRPK